MRLVSQDGMIDVPYENLTIAVDNDNDDGKVHILARGIVEYLSITIAVYSNTDKALKVMELLRNVYVGLPILFQNVDMNESVVDKLKEWKRDGIVLLHDNADSKIEQVNNAIFKFPTDEEVEV